MIVRLDMLNFHLFVYPLSSHATYGWALDQLENAFAWGGCLLELTFIWIRNDMNTFFARFVYVWDSSLRCCASSKFAWIDGHPHWLESDPMSENVGYVDSAARPMKQRSRQRGKTDGAHMLKAQRLRLGSEVESRTQVWFAFQVWFVSESVL